MDLTGKLKQRMVGKRRPIALLMLVSGTFANYAKTLDLPNLTCFSDETSGIFEPALENAKRLNQLFENQSPTNRLKTRSAKPLMMAWLEDFIQRWSQQFGVSEVTLGGSRVHRLLSDGSLAWLHPWSQTDRRLLFTQFDFDYRIHQATFNIGAGYRWFNGTQGTWSSNLFYDQLIQGWHRRLGIGFEYSRDYFAIAFNGYWPLSGWRTVASNEQAKPAPGVDIRLTGYLPNYPQLGVIFTGEHHRGHEVALFKESAKQRLSNPLAAGLGIEYTPVPLCRVSYHYKLAKAGVSEHRYQLALTYQFDRSLTQQLDPAAAVYARSLQHQPLRLVQRNHQLPLSYRSAVLQIVVQPEALEQTLDQKGSNSEQDNKVNTKDSTKQPSLSELNTSTVLQEGKELCSQEEQEKQLSSADAAVKEPLVNLHIPWSGINISSDTQQTDDILSGCTDSVKWRKEREENDLAAEAMALLDECSELKSRYPRSITKNTKKALSRIMDELKDVTGREDDAKEIINSCRKKLDLVTIIVLGNQQS